MLKHCAAEELEALCCDVAALPLALFTEDGLMGDGAEAKSARDLYRKSNPRFNWAFFDCFDGGILLNHLNSGDKFASFAE